MTRLVRPTLVNVAKMVWRMRCEVLNIEVSLVFGISGSLKTDTGRGVKRFALLGAAA